MVVFVEHMVVVTLVKIYIGQEATPGSLSIAQSKLVPPLASTRKKFNKNLIKSDLDCQRYRELI